MAFKGLWKRLYIPWKQQSCSFLDFLQCFKVPNLLFSPLPRQNNFIFVVSCSLTWLQAETSIYQIWQPEVGTNLFSVTWERWVYTMISKFYWKLKHGFTQLTWLRCSHWYSLHLMNSTQLCARPVVARSASWCEVRLPLTIISSLAP